MITESIYPDWLTLTSWSFPAYEQGLSLLSTKCRRVAEGKRLQYSGNVGHSEHGTLFVGVGQQGRDAREHYLLQASGAIADTLLAAMRRFLLNGQATATRFDLQLTVPMPDRLNMADVFLDARRNMPDRSVSMIESCSGPAGSKLATVYLGSRQSQRFWRVYQKMGLGEDVWLRAEIEAKGPLANVMVRDAIESGVTGMFAAEMERAMAFTSHLAVFEPWLSDPGPPIVIGRPNSNTVRWLIEAALPSLDRILQSDDDGEDAAHLAELFGQSIADYRQKHGTV